MGEIGRPVDFPIWHRGASRRDRARVGTAYRAEELLRQPVISGPMLDGYAARAGRRTPAGCGA
ncbi:hypothetical protein [Nostocoides australiense]|nr:hypothetical protein [Tetrasphaera australiensis]